MAVGLLGKAAGCEVAPTQVLDLKERIQTYVFDGLVSEAIPSLLRDFSAPVYLVRCAIHHGTIQKSLGTLTFGGLGYG